MNLSNNPKSSSPLRIEKLECNFAANILVLAPHPDDFDAVAVTLRFFHERGAEIQVAVLTGGASGVQDEFAESADPHLKAYIREAEQRASIAAFGLPPGNLQFLRLTETADGHLAETDLNKTAIHLLVMTLKPELVFLPHGNDTNSDHRLVWKYYLETAQTLTCKQTAWLNEDPKTRQLRRDIYTFFAAEKAAWKAGLLRLHRSQHERNLRDRGHGFDERILDVNRAAAQSWPEPAPETFAEVFELYRNTM